MTLTGGWTSDRCNRIAALCDTNTTYGYRVIRYKSSGEFEDLPSMNTWRQGHACGHFTNVEGEIVSRYLLAIDNTICQVYIVTGGGKPPKEASTETLMKNGGTAWQPVKDLPSGRRHLAGVGLDHGRFIVTGGVTGGLYGQSNIYLSILRIS